MRFDGIPWGTDRNVPVAVALARSQIAVPDRAAEVGEDPAFGVTAN
jgi:hypothetical protein